MTDRLSKTSAEPAEISALLDRVQMPDYERLSAQAHLARAEAIADLMVRAGSAMRSLARAFVARLPHRPRERTA
jgi:hypothetical protein